MASEVVVALISAFSIVLSAVLSAVISNKLIEWRLTSLEKKVDEHNGYAKKFSECQKDIALLKTDIGYIKEAIKDRRAS